MQNETQASPDAMYDVNSFCKAHKIGRTTFYELIKQGRGPRLSKIGRRTLISAEDAAVWRESLSESAE